MASKIHHVELSKRLATGSQLFVPPLEFDLAKVASAAHLVGLVRASGRQAHLLAHPTWPEELLTPWPAEWMIYPDDHAYLLKERPETTWLWGISQSRQHSQELKNFMLGLNSIQVLDWTCSKRRPLGDFFYSCVELGGLSELSFVLSKEVWPVHNWDPSILGHAFFSFINRYPICSLDAPLVHVLQQIDLPKRLVPKPPPLSELFRKDSWALQVYRDLTTQQKQYLRTELMNLFVADHSENLLVAMEHDDQSWEFLNIHTQLEDDLRCRLRILKSLRASSRGGRFHLEDPASLLDVLLLTPQDVHPADQPEDAQPSDETQNKTDLEDEGEAIDTEDNQKTADATESSDAEVNLETTEASTEAPKSKEEKLTLEPWPEPEYQDTHYAFVCSDPQWETEKEQRLEMLRQIPDDESEDDEDDEQNATPLHWDASQLLSRLQAMKLPPIHLGPKDLASAHYPLIVLENDDLKTTFDQACEHFDLEQLRRLEALLRQEEEKEKQVQELAQQRKLEETQKQEQELAKQREQEEIQKQEQELAKQREQEEIQKQEQELAKQRELEEIQKQEQALAEQREQEEIQKQEQALAEQREQEEIQKQEQELAKQRELEEIQKQEQALAEQREQEERLLQELDEKRNHEEEQRELEIQLALEEAELQKQADLEAFENIEIKPEIDDYLHQDKEGWGTEEISEDEELLERLQEFENTGSSSYQEDPYDDERLDDSEGIENPSYDMFLEDESDEDEPEHDESVSESENTDPENLSPEDMLSMLEDVFEITDDQDRPQDDELPKANETENLVTTQDEDTTPANETESLVTTQDDELPKADETESLVTTQDDESPDANETESLATTQDDESPNANETESLVTTQDDESPDANETESLVTTKDDDTTPANETENLNTTQDDELPKANETENLNTTQDDELPKANETENLNTTQDDELPKANETESLNTTQDDELPKADETESLVTTQDDELPKANETESLNTTQDDELPQAAEPEDLFTIHDHDIPQAAEPEDLFTIQDHDISPAAEPDNQDLSDLEQLTEAEISDIIASTDTTTSPDPPKFTLGRRGPTGYVNPYLWDGKHQLQDVLNEVRQSQVLRKSDLSFALVFVVTLVWVILNQVPWL